VLAALVLPRLPLVAALAARGLPATSATPIAVGPDPLGAPLVGDASAAAEAHGVRAGMPLAEALARCPGLALVPADPLGARRRHQRLVGDVEALGLPLEEVGPGRLLIDLAPGLRLHGGAAPLLRRLRGVGRGAPLRLGAGPTRFTALIAARTARRHPRVLGAERLREELAPLPVRLLAEEGGVADDVCRVLLLVGIDRLGGLASLDRLAVRDRLGPDGLAAWRMARGEDDDRIAPRRAGRTARAAITPGHPIASADAIRTAIDLLIARALASPARGAGAPRRLLLEAALATGEAWSRPIALRAPCADPARLRLAVLPHALRLPAPAERLAIELLDLVDEPLQPTLLAPEGSTRAQRLDDAERQVRAALGEGALLRVVEVAPEHPLPEHRHGLEPR
jgi:protein ImuB